VAIWQDWKEVLFQKFLRFGEEGRRFESFFGNNKGIIRYLRPLVEPAVIQLWRH